MCLLTLWARTDARAHRSGDTLGRPSRFRINEGEECAAKRLGEGDRGLYSDWIRWVYGPSEG